MPEVVAIFDYVPAVGISDAIRRMTTKTDEDGNIIWPRLL